MPSAIKSDKPLAGAVKKARDNPEDRLAFVVADFFRAVLPPGTCWFKVANESKRTKAYGGKLKRMGLTAGVPDYYLSWQPQGIQYARGQHLTAWIELKAPKGVLSDGQSAFLEKAQALGHFVAVCTSVEQVEARLREWNCPTVGHLTAGGGIRRQI